MKKKHEQDRRLISQQSRTASKPKRHSLNVTTSISALGLIIMCIGAIVATALVPDGAPIVIGNLSIKSNVIVSAVLAIFGVLASCAATFLISMQAIRSNLQQIEGERRRDVSSAAARTLNDFFQDLTNFRTTWRTISEQHQLPGSTTVAVENIIDNMQNVVQNQIASVLSFNDDKENPYHLLNFSIDCVCANYRCGERLEIPDLGAYPRAQQIFACRHCSAIIKAKRRSDGRVDTNLHRAALRSAPLVEVSAPSPTHSPTEKTWRDYTVKCPNPSCGLDVSFVAHTAHDLAKRGCPECRTSFKFWQNRNVTEVLANNFSSQVNPASLTEHKGKRGIRCGCGFITTEEHFKTNTHGVYTAACYHCGALHWDAAKLLTR